MITSKQQEWLDHLGDNDQVLIIPWDPTCEDKFSLIKRQVQDVLGKEQPVLHRGASALGISGQDEIDIYIPVSKDRFDETVAAVKGLYSEPRSNYPLKRASFHVECQGKHITVFVVNQEDQDWKDGEVFYQILRSDPVKLDKYQKLKEDFAGSSTREYYRAKIEFINEVLP